MTSEWPKKRPLNAQKLERHIIVAGAERCHEAVPRGHQQGGHRGRGAQQGGHRGDQAGEVR